MDTGNKQRETIIYTWRYTVLLLIQSVLLSVGALWSHHLTLLAQGAASGLPSCEASGCMTAVHSGYGKVVGLPVSVFAEALFVFLIARTVWNLVWGFHSRRDLFFTPLAAAAAAGAAVLYFAFISAFILKTFCPYCMVLYVIIALLLLVAGLGMGASFGAIAQACRSVFRAPFWRRERLTGQLASLAVTLTALFISTNFSTQRTTTVSSGISSIQSSTTPEPLNAKLSSKIKIVEFADFECPACRTQALELETLIHEYPDTVELEMVNFPIEAHPHATLAAKIGIVARKHQRFQEYSHAVFSSSDPLTEASLYNLAESAGITREMLSIELNSHEVNATLAADRQRAASADVHATPTLLVNGTRVEGMARADELYRMLNPPSIPNASKQYSQLAALSPGARGETSLRATPSAAVRSAGASNYAVGWTDLANTKLFNVCPTPMPGGTNGCSAVITAWSGATARTKAGSEQLIIWGGGHNDYYGNEVYALNLNLSPPTLTRLTDPTPPDFANFPQANQDGTPVARHTYNDLAYLPNSDRMFSFEGATSPNGSGGGHTWTLDLAQGPPVWHWMDPVSGFNPLSQYGSVTGASCAYDPNTDTVICNWGSDYQFLRYAPNTNTWTKLTGYSESIIPIVATPVIDPIRKLLIYIGNNGSGAFAVSAIDISTGTNWAVQDWTPQVTGCGGMSVNWPGVAYDSATGMIVGWPNSGNSVYIFNPDTKSCTTQTFPNGPADTTYISHTGTFGRFAYFPSLDVFAVVNAADNDAYVLRLDSDGSHGGGPGNQNGLGASTSTCLDQDGDGYGVGPGCGGPDSDDSDPAIHTGGEAIAKYGSLNAFLNHLGYDPTRIWFMDLAGNDATGIVNDLAHPFKTYGAIAGQVAPGDMIMLRNNWNGRISTPSGQVGKPIIVMSYPGELAIIDPAGYPGALIETLSTSWLIVDGIKTMNAANVNGGNFHDNIFRHMETIGSGSQGLGGIAAFNGLVNVTVEDCVFHDIGTNGQHCLYFGSRELPSSNVTVRRNICYNAPWNGFHFNGRFENLQVDQNYIYSVGIAAISLQEGISNSFIRNNVAFNFASDGLEISNYPGDCAQFGQGGSGSICPYDQTGNLIENNTFYATGFDPTEGGQSAAPRAVTVVNGAVNEVGNLGGNAFRNNIFVSLGAFNLSAGDYPPIVFASVDAAHTSYLATSTFTNNIFWSLQGDAGVIGIGPGSSYGYQGYTCDQAAALTHLSGCINADPKFIDASPGYWNATSRFNFNLAAGSPAIAGGVTSGAPATDIIGAPRGIPPSIGAYEFGSAHPRPAITSGPSATPNPASVGDAILFSAAAIDTDGDTLSYSWNFADGSSASGTSVSHSYSTAGNYAVMVTVSDGNGDSTQASVVVTVNAPQLYQLAVNGGSGGGSYAAGTVVTITANAPPLGQIFKQWTGATVADPAAATTTLTMPAANTSVTANFKTIPVQTLHVAAVSMILSTTRKGKAAIATVMIKDNNGIPVNGATVTGSWSGLTKASVSGITEAAGTVKFTSAVTKKTGTFTFTVNSVAAAGSSYDSSQNARTSASITSRGVMLSSDLAVTGIPLGSVKTNGSFNLALPLPEDIPADSVQTTAANLPAGTRVHGTFITGKLKRVGSYTFTVEFKARTETLDDTGVPVPTTIQTSQQFTLTVTQ
jgi:protein-disulfide isomerase